MKNKVLYFAGRVLQSSLLYICFAAISLAAYLIFALINGMLSKSVMGISDYAVSAAMSLLICFSVTRAFAVSDKDVCKRYYQSHPRTLKGKIRFVFASYEYWIDGVLFFLLCLLLPPVFGHKGAYLLLGFDPELAGAAQRLVFSLLYTEIFLCFSLICRISCFRQWDYTEKTIGKSKTEGRVGSVISVALVYCIGCLVIPSVLTALVGGMVLAVSAGLTFPVIFIIAALVFAVALGKYVRAFFKRMRFVSQVKKRCKAANCPISEVKCPYLSLFTDKCECNFTVIQEGREYSCRLVAGITKGDPINFKNDGTYDIIHAYKFKGMELFSHVKTRTYSITGEGEKVLIVLPVPTLLYADGGLKDVCDRVYGYRLHTASSFMNAVERGCLHK